MGTGSTKHVLLLVENNDMYLLLNEYSRKRVFFCNQRWNLGFLFPKCFHEIQELLFSGYSFNVKSKYV